MRQTSEDRELRSARITAHHEAVRRLISRHRDEYDELHKEERVRQGLPEQALSQSSLRRENDRLRERIAELEQTNNGDSA